MTIAEWMVHSRQRLALAGVEASLIEAQLLVGHLFLKDRTWVLTNPDETVPVLAAEALLQRRESGEPLAYILGAREFYGRRFSVRPGVLIPRQETETLIETTLSLGLPTKSCVLDIGTGSGCIAVTLKLERPQWNVTACDISSSALEIAQQNATNLGASVEIVESDLLGAFRDVQFDLIISNPPYIGVEESIPGEVRNFEPPEALFAGRDGLAIYDRLAAEAGANLKPNGLLVLELGSTQREAVTSVFSEKSWKLMKAADDLLGHSRCLVFMAS